MPVIRRFHRHDRDQLTALVNRHVAAVVPGVTLSVNTVLSTLEREPDEVVVDPWVAERACLVAEVEHVVVAAALLHRFRADDEVGESYRGTGELRWFVCDPGAVAAGSALLGAVLQQMRHWGVSSVGADVALPAPGCYGVPEVMPHLRALLTDAGFGEPARRELVLAARCEDLTAAHPDVRAVRTVGTLGVRFTLDPDGSFIEVCPPGADVARNGGIAWADIGNLAVADGADATEVVPALLAVGARWLLLGGVTRVIDYWAADVDPPERLAALERAGFVTLSRNDRGMQRRL